MTSEPAPEKILTRARRYLVTVLHPTRPWREVSREVRRGGLRDTAWLDGLRGYCALLVYVTHHVLLHHDQLESSFGYEGGYHLLRVPLFRHFFTGSHAAVAIFFVISGYVLSVRVVRLVNAGHRHAALELLSSAMFRRYIRLYLPVASLCATIVAAHYIFGLTYIGNYVFQDFLSDEVRGGLINFWNWSYPMRGSFSKGVVQEDQPFHARYGYHTWSIAVEYQGSMLIFVLLSMFSGCARRWRLASFACLFCYFVAHGHWACGNFIAGLIMVECDEMAKSRKTDTYKFSTTTLWIVLATGLYLTGVPQNRWPDITVEQASLHPGWGWLRSVVPSRYRCPGTFINVFTSIMLVPTIGRLPVLRRFFESAPLQYLGRISFAFYLVHGPLLFTLAARLYKVTGHDRDHPEWYTDLFPLPAWGPYGFELNFVVTHVVILPVTLYVGQVCHHVFDESANRLSRWLETIMRETQQ